MAWRLSSCATDFPKTLGTDDRTERQQAAEERYNINIGTFDDHLPSMLHRRP